MKAHRNLISKFERTVSVTDKPSSSRPRISDLQITEVLWETHIKRIANTIHQGMGNFTKF